MTGIPSLLRTVLVSPVKRNVMVVFGRRTALPVLMKVVLIVSSGSGVIYVLTMLPMMVKVVSAIKGTIMKKLWIHVSVVI